MMQDPEPTSDPDSCLSHDGNSLSMTFHVDSGAGQCLCSNKDAFVTLQACAIQMMGVSGSLSILGVGTAMFLVVGTTAKSSIVLIHNCLLSPGGSFNLVSVSQLQHSGSNTVDFNRDSPTLTLQSGTGRPTLPLILEDGLFSFLAQPLHINDERYTTLPRFHLTAKGAYVPPTASPTLSSALVASGSWNYTLLVAPSASRRVVALPAVGGSSFDAALRDFAPLLLLPLLFPQHEEHMTLTIPFTWRICQFVGWAPAMSDCVAL